MQDLYTERYRPLLREIEEELNTGEIDHIHGQKTQYCYNVRTHTLHLSRLAGSSGNKTETSPTEGVGQWGTQAVTIWDAVTSR